VEFPGDYEFVTIFGDPLTKNFVLGTRVVFIGGEGTMRMGFVNPMIIGDSLT
jgi:hypothetical protein